MTAGTGQRAQAVARTVILVSADSALRQRIGTSLTELRWTVRETGGGAETMAQIERLEPQAVLLDSWLPDLEVGEFSKSLRLLYPAMEMLWLDGGVEGEGTRSPWRNELLHALREAQEGADSGVPTSRAMAEPGAVEGGIRPVREAEAMRLPEPVKSGKSCAERPGEAGTPLREVAEMIGRSARMRELGELIFLVAPRQTTVLIEGETGTGKEVVARALHRLSSRAAKSFTVLNCAAIPESLLEAELFGHTRGAFTGAVQSRTGRIEAAHGGTLFLDEIGEMPLALQAKMLRFLECGELQRVGDNDTMRVDVRVIAATHQPLAERAKEKTFRLDLYHRLAVFPVEVPPLRERKEDLALLAEHFLEKLGREEPRKHLSVPARTKLEAYDWPGNVRELMHVLERAVILSGERPELGAADMRFGRVSCR